MSGVEEQQRLYNRFVNRHKWVERAPQLDALEHENAVGLFPAAGLLVAAPCTFSRTETEVVTSHLLAQSADQLGELWSRLRGHKRTHRHLLEVQAARQPDEDGVEYPGEPIGLSTPLVPSKGTTNSVAVPMGNGTIVVSAQPTVLQSSVFDLNAALWQSLCKRSGRRMTVGSEHHSVVNVAVKPKLANPTASAELSWLPKQLTVLVQDTARVVEVKVYSYIHALPRYYRQEQELLLLHNDLEYAAFIKIVQKATGIPTLDKHSLMSLAFHPPSMGIDELACPVMTAQSMQAKLQLAAQNDCQVASSVEALALLLYWSHAQELSDYVIPCRVVVAQDQSSHLLLLDPPVSNQVPCLEAWAVMCRSAVYDAAAQHTTHSSKPAPSAVQCDLWSIGCVRMLVAWHPDVCMADNGTASNSLSVFGRIVNPNQPDTASLIRFLSMLWCEGASLLQLSANSQSEMGNLVELDGSTVQRLCQELGFGDLKASNLAPVINKLCQLHPGQYVLMKRGVGPTIQILKSLTPDAAEHSTHSCLDLHNLLSIP